MNQNLTDEQRDIAKRTEALFSKTYLELRANGIDEEGLVSGLCASFLTAAQAQLGAAGVAEWLRNMADLIDAMTRGKEKLN